MDPEIVTEEAIETLNEKFLDGVFDAASKLPRKEYMESVASKQNWIFNSKKLREKVDKELGQ